MYRIKQSYDIDEHDHHSVEGHVRLDSPRLRKACRIQGIRQEELQKMSFDDIKHMYRNESLDRRGLELAAQHQEERRQEKLRIVLKERNRIIEEEIDWEHVPSQQQRRDLFSSKGRTTVYKPSNVDSKRRKERLELGEMLINQQAELDQQMLEDEEIGLKDTYEQRLSHHRAKESQIEKKTFGIHPNIEVIDNEEFAYDDIGKQGIQLLKRRRNKGELYAGRRRRKNQQYVYKKEIRQFKRMEDQLREKERRAHLYKLFRGAEGHLLENRTIFTNRIRREKMTPNERAMKDYLVEQMKLREEEDMQRRKEKESVIEYAKKESKKMIDSKRGMIRRGMVAYEDREKAFGPNFREAVDMAQKNPTAYVRLMQSSLFEEDLPKKKKVTYNLDDSSDEELIVDKAYPFHGSPVGTMYTSSRWGKSPQRHKTLYELFHWKKAYDVEVKRPGKIVGYSTISSNFAKNSDARGSDSSWGKASTASRFYADTYPLRDDDNYYEEDLGRISQGVKMGNDHGLRSLIEYEKNREAERDSSLREFDSRREKRYLEKVFNTERTSNRMKISNLMDLQHEVFEDF